MLQPAIFHRLIRVFIITITLGLFYIIAAKLLSRESGAQFTWPSHQPALSDPGRDNVNTFVHALFEALNVSRPACGPLQRTSDAGGIVFKYVTAATQRPDVVPVNMEQLEALRDAHDTFKNWTLETTVLPWYTPGSRGIVSTAAGSSLPVFLVSLRLLRRSGCTLPVELFLGLEDEKSFVCDALLPSLNARCIRFADLIQPEDLNRLRGYQFKVYAILLSTFEEALFMDSDNLAVANPEHLFTTVPFLSTGLVLWPDYWASTTSQYFYDIQNTSKPIPTLNSRPTSESGQVLVSKRSHARALFMSAYYNSYGNDFYYDLLSQGGPGQGDKETFLAGAEALNLPFHQVSKSMDTVGYYEAGHYHGVAMLQYDPTDNISPLNLHHNFPKPDPVQLFSDDPIYGAAIDHTIGGYHRLWGLHNLTMKRFGRDFEHEMWEEIRFVTCELGDRFLHWHPLQTTPERKGSCSSVEDYISQVFDQA